MYASYNWYYRHPHVPQLSQYSFSLSLIFTLWSDAAAKSTSSQAPLFLFIIIIIIIIIIVNFSHQFSLVICYMAFLR